jgi:hypothetical protein
VQVWDCHNSLTQKPKYPNQIKKSGLLSETFSQTVSVTCHFIKTHIQKSNESHIIKNSLPGWFPKKKKKPQIFFYPNKTKSIEFIFWLEKSKQRKSSNMIN